MTAKAMGLISSLFNVALFREGLFANYSSSNAYQSLPLFSFTLHSFPYYRIGDDLLLYGFMEDLVTAVIAEVFIMLL